MGYFHFDINYKNILIQCLKDYLDKYQDNILLLEHL